MQLTIKTDKTEKKEVFRMKLKNIIFTIAVGAICFTGGLFTSKPMINHKQTLENENVKIEYIQVNSEIYDLLITPKNGTNLNPEYSLESGKNYKDAYLVGLTKEKAEQLHQNYSSLMPFTWNQ